MSLFETVSKYESTLVKMQGIKVKTSHKNTQDKYKHRKNLLKSAQRLAVTFEPPVSTRKDSEKDYLLSQREKGQKTL